MTDVFAGETRLMTLRGEVPARELRPGELLLTLSGSGAALKPLLRATAAPFAGPPVRLRAGAIADGSPRRDLLLDAAQAVRCGDDRLVAVGALANGATVARDGAAGMGVRLELASGDVVLAEGLAVGLGIAGTADPEARARLLARAAGLGWAETADPGLCVVIDGAAVSLPAEGGVVTLPPGVEAVRVVSRSVVPAEIDPANPDHRRLGVALAGVELDGVPMSLDDPGFAGGFLPPEPGLRRTDGDGTLLLARPAARLTLRAVPIWTRYWVAPG